MKIKLVDGKPVDLSVDKLIDYLSKFESSKVRLTRSGKFVFIEDPSKEEYEEDEESDLEEDGDL